MQDRTTTPDHAAPAVADGAPRVAPRRASGELLRAATRDGTARLAKRYARRYADDFYRVGPLRLTFGSLGLGTYLGDHTDAEDAAYVETIVEALRSGVNLVDTAVNYRCQRSERAVGEALRRLFAEGALRRDEVVLCSKGGYVPLDGEPPADRAAYDDYLQRTYYAPGIMRPEDLAAGGHCLAPAFLADQVQRSRANLGVPTLDAYYIHNPEQQLASVSREVLLTRLRDAFTQMEACADAGEIACYGVASWQAFRVPPDHKEYLSLSELVHVAHEVAGAGHRFRIVQLPVSLAMPEAVRAPTQPISRRRHVSALEAASELGLCAVASAPLMQGRLTSGLPPAVAELFPGLTTDAQRALAFVRGLPHVTAVLLGTRRPAHLHEALDAARPAR
jgi:aryl-alcohol dehydrogenase-like predicted oxidoreductase